MKILNFIFFICTKTPAIHCCRLQCIKYELQNYSRLTLLAILQVNNSNIQRQAWPTIVHHPMVVQRMQSTHIWFKVCHKLDQMPSFYNFHVYCYTYLQNYIQLIWKLIIISRLQPTCKVASMQFNGVVCRVPNI